MQRKNWQNMAKTKNTCKKYEHFDANGWLGWDDAYCLNCLQENCPCKPKVTEANKEFILLQFEVEKMGLA